MKRIELGSVFYRAGPKGRQKKQMWELVGWLIIHMCKVCINFEKRVVYKLGGEDL